MKKIVFAWFVFTVSFIFIQNTELACSCVDLGESLEQQVNGSLKNSKAVFVGEVIEVMKNSDNVGFTTKFKVEESWKDFSPSEITFVGDGSSCEYYFTLGKKYLVFAYEWKNKLTTGDCSGNREIDKAAEELKILGKGNKPLAAEDKAQIVESILSNFDFSKRLFYKDEKKDVVYLSTEDLSPDFVPKVGGINFVLVSPKEIKEKTETVFGYYVFEDFRAEGSTVLVSFTNVYIDSRTRCSGCAGSASSSHGIRYEFRKVDGKWQGKILYGYGSES